MKKLFKLLLKLIAVLIGLFLIISLMVAVFVDINHYKNNIVELVEAETGLNLTINGDLNLSIISGLKFNAEDIKLSYNKVLIADVEFIDLGVSLWSLYQREPVITSLVLNVRELNLARDKNGNFNLLPLLAAKTDKSSVKTNADEKNKSEAGKFFLNNLSIHDFKLSLSRFSYQDDLESLSIKLADVEAFLSLLPIIDHHELVIDDPRVLVAYSYSGKLTVKQALSNDYQIADLSLEFQDQMGDFLAEELTFSFIQRGKAHRLPPLMFAAKGKLQFKLAYHIPDGASEPLWARPDMIKVAKFDFNLPELKWTDDKNQLETKNAHLILAEVSIFEGRQYTLDDLLIHSLLLDSKQVNLITKEQGEYHLKKVLLQVNDFPAIHNGKLLDLTSDVFLKQFARQGEVRFSTDSITNKLPGFNNIKVLLEAKDKGIILSTLSFNALESEVNGNGHISLQGEIPQWQFKIHTEKLNLQPVANLLNSTNELKGHVSINNQFSGAVQNSDVKISSGRVQVSGNNIEVSGMEVDKILEDFQTTQSVGLLDVGAVALLGPAGVLVTKGNDYRNLTKSLDNRGSSKIKQLRADISFVNEIATMNDVAFATEKHRLAVKGKIDTKSRHFKGFEVATVDRHGCPIYKEEVMGSLDSPTVKKVNVLVSGVVNPVSSLVAKITNPLKSKCDKPFYSGSVKSPIN